MTARLRFWERSGVAIASLLLLAFAFNWPFLFGGFQADDLLLIRQMAEEPLPYSRWMGVWSNADIPTFNTLWWRDPDFEGTFWRPLPSLVIEGSLRLFGQRALPLHLLSIGLHGAVAVLVYANVRRLGADALVALVAGLLFVACEDHALAVGWISTITDLLCVAGILTALRLHLGWLAHRRRRNLIAAQVITMLAMACKESAAAAPLLLILASFLFPNGADEPVAWAWAALRARVVATMKNVGAWLPATLVLLVYVSLYKGLSLGRMNNLMYANPLLDPGVYLVHLVQHLPIMWLSSLSPVPPSLTMLSPQVSGMLAVVGALTFAGLIVCIRHRRNQSLVVFALLAYLVALLPQMGADASERGLYLPVALLSPALAVLMVRVGWLARRLTEPLTSVPRLERFAGGYVLACVLAPGVVMSATMPSMYIESLSAPERRANTGKVHIEEAQPEHVLVLNTAGMFETLYAGATLAPGHEKTVDVRLLSSCNAVMRVERVDDHAFVLRADRRGWLSNMFARLVRTEPRLWAGRRYDTDLFTATIVETTPEEDDVLAVRFELRHALADTRLLFLHWDGKQLRPLDMSALKVGERKALADTSDVWASMM